LSHAAQFSWIWAGGWGGRSGSHHIFNAKEGKILTYTKTGFGLGGGGRELLNIHQFFVFGGGFEN